MKDGSFKNLPVELMMAGYKLFDKIPNILSSCAFYLIKNKWTCQPNDIWKSMVEMYYTSSDMNHILFTPPFLWEDKLSE
jgi:hypothetical protein